MQVDQSRQDVFSRGVDLGVRRGASCASIADGNRVKRDDIGNRIALDHDVVRTRRRRSVADDDHRVSDYEARGSGARLDAASPLGVEAGRSEEQEGDSKQGSQVHA
jgi:hypothetical protein